MSNTIRMEIGKLIKLKREEKGLSRRQLALAVGVKEAMISHVENGIRGVSPKRAADYEQVLGIPRRELCPQVFS